MRNAQLPVDLRLPRAYLRKLNRIKLLGDFRRMAHPEDFLTARNGDPHERRRGIGQVP